MFKVKALANEEHGARASSTPLAWGCQGWDTRAARANFLFSSLLQFRVAMFFLLSTLSTALL